VRAGPHPAVRHCSRTPDSGTIAILAKAEDLFVEGSTEDTVIYMM